MLSFSEDENSENIKIILLGESGVGKTSIIKCFNDEIFNNNRESTASCSQITKQIEINNNKYLLDIWDTAGQEKYRSLNTIFIKDAKIIIYDISSKNSFLQLNFWYDFIHEQINFKNIILGIIGNKSDLFEQEKVTEEEGREYATKCGGYFSLLSVIKTKSLINSYFIHLVSMYLEKTSEIDFIQTPSIKITKERIIKKMKKKGFVEEENRKMKKFVKSKMMTQ